jgi:hypothetical protein
MLNLFRKASRYFGLPALAASALLVLTPQAAHAKEGASFYKLMNALHMPAETQALTKKALNNMGDKRQDVIYLDAQRLDQAIRSIKKKPKGPNPALNELKKIISEYADDPAQAQRISFSLTETWAQNACLNFIDQTIELNKGKDKFTSPFALPFPYGGGLVVIDKNDSPESRKSYGYSFPFTKEVLAALGLNEDEHILFTLFHERRHLSRTTNRDPYELLAEFFVKNNIKGFDKLPAKEKIDVEKAFLQHEGKNNETRSDLDAAAQLAEIKGEKVAEKFIKVLAYYRAQEALGANASDHFTTQGLLDFVRRTDPFFEPSSFCSGDVELVKGINEGHEALKKAGFEEYEGALKFVKHDSTARKLLAFAADGKAYIIDLEKRGKKILAETPSTPGTPGISGTKPPSLKQN